MAQMLQLNSESDFHFEILRILALSTAHGADVGEVLVAANKVVPGDFESFYTAFFDLAEHVRGVSESIDAKKHQVSARSSRFREATYYRSADFFLHGNWDDPRINDLWTRHLYAFDKAISLLPVPGERIELQGPGFTIPAIFFGCGQPGPRPTVLMCNGFDGAQEEMYHVLGVSALQRGMNAITFEGPGQPTVRRKQNLGFIPDWEKVVTPVVDYALTRKEVDPNAIALAGLSFGGYLTPRAAAFEHRLAAVFALDGVMDFGHVIAKTMGAEAGEPGNSAALDEAVNKLLQDPKTPTKVRWGIEQGFWSFNTRSASEWLAKTRAYTLEGVVDKIKAPVFVGDAENDLFFPDQAKTLAEKLGDRATYYKFKTADAAGEHCSVGAIEFSNQVVFDWFEDVLASKNRC